jgi:hypothetical protein
MKNTSGKTYENFTRTDEMSRWQLNSGQLKSGQR